MSHIKKEKKKSSFLNFSFGLGKKNNVRKANASFESGHSIDESNNGLPPPVPGKGSTFDKAEFKDSDFPDFQHPKVPKLSKGKNSKSMTLSSIENKLNGEKKEPMPVIVVTDIGADIDDTLALFVLLGATDAVKIVAVVTSVNNGLHRGAVTRGFLRVLGIDDDDIEILPSVDGCIAGCYIPDTFPATTEASLGNLAETPRRILEICKEHQDTGVLLYGIASLSPISAAMKLDQNEGGIMKKAIKHVYLQGNVDLVKTEADGSDKITSDPLDCLNQVVKIAPNPDAYNFKNDMDAAAFVFDYLQSTTPFTFLGKHAAYRVPIRKGDFSTWTHKISAAWKETTENGKGDIPNPPDLLHTAKRQMKTFRSKNPAKFDQIYKVPGDLSPQEMEQFDWFDDLPTEYVCSHPYDPLLGLVMILDIRKAQNKTNLNNSEPLLKSGKSIKNGHTELFEKFYCKNENGDDHVILGNIPIRHSIPDPDKVHDVLVKHISQGLVFHGSRRN